MKLYYEEPLVKLYHGDASEHQSRLWEFTSSAIITDPVWPNTKVKMNGHEDPQDMLRRTLLVWGKTTRRIVIHMGCDRSQAIAANSMVVCSRLGWQASCSQW